MNIRINGRIWLETTSADSVERFMGIGRLELLEHIRQTGSINQAAKAMNMSYKRAWDLVQSMNTQAKHHWYRLKPAEKKAEGLL